MDSDSDDDYLLLRQGLQGNNKRKATTTKPLSLQEDDSDDDDDDLLLMATTAGHCKKTSKRIKQQEENKKTQHRRDIIQQALQYAQVSLEQDRHMAQIQQQEITFSKQYKNNNNKKEDVVGSCLAGLNHHHGNDDEALKQRALQLAKKPKQQQPKSRQATHAVMDGTNANATHKHRNMALVEAADTQQTRQGGSHFRLNHNSNNPMNPHVPQTYQQAVEYLQLLLLEESSSSRTTTSEQGGPHHHHNSDNDDDDSADSSCSSSVLVQRALKHHIQKGTLDQFLLSGFLTHPCQEHHHGRHCHHGHHLSTPLLQWLFLMACTTTTTHNTALSSETTTTTTKKSKNSDKVKGKSNDSNSDHQNDKDKLIRLGMGAYQTLVQLWSSSSSSSNNINNHNRHEDYLFTLDDLPAQWQAWFGLSLRLPSSEKKALSNNNNNHDSTGGPNPVNRDNNSSTSGSSTSNTTTALYHFWHLWDLCFSNKLIFYEPKKDNSVIINNIIATLLVMSLDPMLEQTETLAHHQGMTHLKNNVAHIFSAISATTTGDDELDASVMAKDLWEILRSVVVTFPSSSSSSLSSPSLSSHANHQDDKDENAKPNKNPWLCLARVVRNLVLSSCLSPVLLQQDQPTTRQLALQVALELAWKILTACFADAKKKNKKKNHPPSSSPCNDDDDDGWNMGISQMMNNWGLVENKHALPQWQALAGCAVALNKLASSSTLLGGNDDTDDDGNMEGEEEHGGRAAQCLAIMEIAHVVLEAAVALFAAPRQQQQSHMDEYYPALYAAMECLEASCHTIAAHSSGQGMGNAYALRVHYYATCLRQYPRLVKGKYASKRNQPAAFKKMQSTLDSFFSLSQQSQ